jgi:mannan endo-1,4-beta-mannosidase
MTIADASAGGNVFQQSDSGSAKQLWYFNPVDGNCEALEPTPEPTPEPTLEPTPDNQPPVAMIEAVADHQSGQTVTLDGSGSTDPDGDRINYLWTQTQGEQIELTDNTGPTLNFVAPTVDQSTAFTFELSVDDGSLSDQTSVQFLVLPEGNPSAPGLYVSGRQLLESNGNALVLRGINVPHAWYQDRTSSSLSDIANTGANSVRIVLASGERWSKTSESEISNLIAQAKANQLIAILEVHDTTGYGEQSGAATLSQAVDYWKSIKGALIGQEDNVVINIGNEPLGNDQLASAWIDGHIEAVQALRDAGFNHAIMVDAPNWGQDWENIMRDNATSVLAADPQKNVIFSVHMYQVYQDANTISSYMSTFIQNDLALVVGEFGADHLGEEVDEASVMSYAEQYGYGYLGWSWSGNSGGAESLDIVQNFDPSLLSGWGETLINGNNGIKATSTAATVFASNEPSDPGTPINTGNPEHGTVRVFYMHPSDVAYDAAIPEGITGVMQEAQRYFQQELGVTFKLNDPVVEVVEGEQERSYYENTPQWGEPYWYSVANMHIELRRRFDLGAPDNRWVIVGEISAEGEGAGGGANSGWVFLNEHDAEGAAGGRGGSMGRWYGGMVHELGHAFGLPDSTSTDGTPMSASFYSYPDCHFTEAQKSEILNGLYGSFFQ